jgi:hypothetical protein
MVCFFRLISLDSRLLIVGLVYCGLPNPLFLLRLRLHIWAVVVVLVVVVGGLVVVVVVVVLLLCVIAAAAAAAAATSFFLSWR